MEDSVNCVHQLIKWEPSFGAHYYNQDRNAIVIRQDGFYFVYVRITFICPDTKANLNVILYTWSEKYRLDVVLTQVWDACSNGQSRNVFVGQQFDLSEGEYLSVVVTEGYRQITDESVFGAFLT